MNTAEFSMKTAFLLLLLTVTASLFAQKPELWGDRPSRGGMQIFHWQDGKVTDLTPARETWQLWGARVLPTPKDSPSKESAPVELWGAVKVSQGWKLWHGQITPQQTQISPQVLPRIFRDLKAMDYAGTYTALVTDEGQGPQLFLLSPHGTNEWAWEQNVTITTVAVLPSGQVAVAGSQKHGPGWINARPFLWINGHQQPAPTGWRGLLTGLSAGPEGFQAVGRGAPLTQEPVQTLWYHQGQWLTLNVPSDGNFADFLGEVSEKKTALTKAPPTNTPTKNPVIFGTLAVGTPGKQAFSLKPWLWQKGKLTFWDTPHHLTAYGPAGFGSSAAICGVFATDHGSELRLWQGKGGPGELIKGWPAQAVPRALTWH